VDKPVELASVPWAKAASHVTAKPARAQSVIEPVLIGTKRKLLPFAAANSVTLNVVYGVLAHGHFEKQLVTV